MAQNTPSWIGGSCEICWGQISRLVRGFHPLFLESDLAPLCHPLSATFIKTNSISGCFRWAKVGNFGPKHVPGTPFHQGKNKWFREAQLIVSPSVLWSLSYQHLSGIFTQTVLNTFNSASREKVNMLASSVDAIAISNLKTLLTDWLTHSLTHRG